MKLFLLTKNMPECESFDLSMYETINNFRGGGKIIKVKYILIINKQLNS